MLFSGLNDPPSVPNKPKLDELSAQWTSLQVGHTKSDVELGLGLIIQREVLESVISFVLSCQAPDADLDLFGSISAPSAVFPTSHTTAVSQGMQDLSMLDFGGGKGYDSALKRHLTSA